MQRDPTGTPGHGAPGAEDVDGPAGAAPPGSEGPGGPGGPGGNADGSGPDQDPGPNRWSRRAMLGLVGAAGLAGAGYPLVRNLSSGGDGASGDGAATAPRREVRTAPSSSTTTTEGAVEPGSTARWSDPATWGGQVPGPGDVAGIDRPVLLDVDAEVGGVRIGLDGEVIFEPAASRTLTSGANVVVDGALRMRPDDATVEHRLVFSGVDEAAYVGGGMTPDGHLHEPMDSDVGLWVLGQGVIDLAGAPKSPWTTLAGAAEAGADAVEVVDATGWRAGDEIVVLPTEGPAVDEHYLHHDRRTVAAVDGHRVTLDEPLAHPHPEARLRPGVVRRAEVLNLTRNVRVEGAEGGRAHVIVLAHVPQTVSHVGFRHLGPQQDEAGVLGRYVLHFHMVEEGSRGSLVEGAVAYDCGNHAYVAHLSNGVTFRDCVAHNTAEEPYWWDLGGPDEAAGTVPSHDIVYERCVAHLVNPGSDKYGLSGFAINAGRGNVARGCVASAILGDTESSAGYHWPSHSRDENTWVFEDNTVHDSPNTGIYFWQNNVPRTVVDNFVAYHLDWGIQAGAYANETSYHNSTIYGCTSAGIFIQALPGEAITYEGNYVDVAGMSPYAVVIGEHLVDSDIETQVTGCTFRGGTEAQVAVPVGGEYHQLYAFDGCTFEGNEFYLADDVPESTRLRVTTADGGEMVLRRADQGGAVRQEWNAAVTPA